MKEHSRGLIINLGMVLLLKQDFNILVRVIRAKLRLISLGFRFAASS